MTISDTAKAQVFQQEGGGFLELIEIDHADLADPLRFVNNNENIYKSAAMPSPYTFTRASVKWADNLAGAWSSFIADAPAITNKGVSLEALAVNGVRNNGLSGAVAGTPGTVPTGWGGFAGTGLSRTSIALNTISGIDCIDIRQSGTASGTALVTAINGTTTNGWPVTPGETIYASAMLAVVAGALNTGLSNAMRVQWYDSGGASVGTVVDTSINAITSTLTRISSAAIVVPTGAVFATVSFRLGLVNAAAYDVTLRYGDIQLEDAKITSPIIGTGTTTTRQADAMTLHMSAVVGDVVATFDDNSTQTIGIAMSGDFVIDPTLLNRPVVKKITHAYETWDFANASYIDAHGGDLYIAFPFSITLPKDKPRTAPSASIRIDNVSRQIGQLIRQLSTPPTINISIVRIDDFDTVEQQFPPLLLRNVEYDNLTVSGELSVDDMMREPFPQRTFSPSEYPGVHQ